MTEATVVEGTGSTGSSIRFIPSSGDIVFDGNVELTGSGGLYRVDGLSDTLHVKGNFIFATSGDQTQMNYNQTVTGAQTIDGILTMINSGDGAASQCTWRGTQGAFKVGGFRNLGGVFTSL